MPCGHCFDLGCIATSLKMPGELHKKCPMCRARPEEIRYAFTPEHTFKAYIPGKADEDSNPFLREDEIVPLGASEAARRKRLELRRLRTLPDVSQTFMVTYAYGANVEGDNVVVVKRELLLHLQQEDGTMTRCTLKRTMTLKTFQGFDPDELEEITSEPRLVARVRGDVIAFLDGLVMTKPLSELRVDSPEYHVECDDRGLHASAMRNVVVEKEPGKEDITIEETLTTVEKFLPDLPSEEKMALDVIEGIGKEERERMVRLMRQEMQGVVEYAWTIPQVGENWVDMDDTSTAVFEETREAEIECLYCDKRHRNGACMLPLLYLEDEEDSDESMDSGEDESTNATTEGEVSGVGGEDMDSVE